MHPNHSVKIFHFLANTTCKFWFPCFSTELILSTFIAVCLGQSHFGFLLEMSAQPGLMVLMLWVGMGLYEGSTPVSAGSLLGDFEEVACVIFLWKMAFRNAFWTLCLFVLQYILSVDRANLNRELLTGKFPGPFANIYIPSHQKFKVCLMNRRLQLSAFEPQAFLAHMQSTCITKKNSAVALEMKSSACTVDLRLRCLTPSSSIHGRASCR